MPRVNGGSPGKPTSRSGSKSRRPAGAVAQRHRRGGRPPSVRRARPAGVVTVGIGVGLESHGPYRPLDREVTERRERGSTLGEPGEEGASRSIRQRPTALGPGVGTIAHGRDSSTGSGACPTRANRCATRARRMPGVPRAAHPGRTPAVIEGRGSPSEQGGGSEAPGPAIGSPGEQDDGCGHHRVTGSTAVLATRTTTGARSPGEQRGDDRSPGEQRGDDRSPGGRLRTRVAQREPKASSALRTFASPRSDASRTNTWFDAAPPQATIV